LLSSVETIMGRAPVCLRNSSNVVGKTACGCPAAAQTTSKASSARSIRISGAGFARVPSSFHPNGLTPPMLMPEADLMNSASARCNFSTPSSRATNSVSTRCAPDVITKRGRPSGSLKTIEEAI